MLQAGANPPFHPLRFHTLSLMLACCGLASDVTTLRGAGDETAAIVAVGFASDEIGNLHLAAGSPELLAGERYDCSGKGQTI